jgi:hypothetical protein
MIADLILPHRKSRRASGNYKPKKKRSRSAAIVAETLRRSSEAAFEFSKSRIPSLKWVMKATKPGARSSKLSDYNSRSTLLMKRSPLKSFLPSRECGYPISPSPPLSLSLYLFLFSSSLSFLFLVYSLCNR